MTILDFGHDLLYVAAVVTGAIALLCILGTALRDRRFVVAARTGFYALFVLLSGVSACLVHGFVEGIYNNEYIFNHSESELGVGYKLAGIWAGLEGSLVFWTLILVAMSAIAAFQHRWSARHPAGRRMEPYTYLVLSVIIGFFVFLSIQEDAFSQMPLEDRVLYAKHFRVPMDAHANLTDGKGLNPQLANYWFIIHPPSLYVGLVSFAIPFAFGLAALITAELGSYWVRITRRWAMVSWMFLTCGIVLGGLWAYRQLGWGGYWAWDPVENASFLPWCTATAFLHSIMIQERRDMLKWWNACLMIFTFYLTVEATYMTRSGEVASVHTFALNESLGDVFRIFKFAIAGVGLFLLFYRIRELRGSHRLESLLSREAAFYINNLVLVAMCLVVWFLSWLPTTSQEYLMKKEAVDVPFYNTVMTPLFALLLFLTAVGPGLGWVKTSARSLRKNFLGPTLVSLAFVALVYAYLLANGNVHSAREIFVPKMFADAVWGKQTDDLFFAAGIYPTGLLLFLSALIVATVCAEFLRAVRGRMRVRKEDVVDAAFNVFTRDNRRYGGYIVHVGIALMTVGIVASSMFRHYEKVALKIGDTARIGPYDVTAVEANRSFHELSMAVQSLNDGTRTMEEVEPGLAFLRDEVLFRVTRAPDVPTAHGQSADGEDGPSAEAPPARLVCELRPERRFFPKQGQWISEVSIERRLLGDIYFYYGYRDEKDQVHLEVYLNPLMILIWLGWFIMIGGGLYALLPLTRKRVGLSE